MYKIWLGCIEMRINYNNIDFSREITNKYKTKCKGLYALDDFNEVSTKKSHKKFKPNIKLKYKKLEAAQVLRNIEFTHREKYLRHSNRFPI